MGHLNEIAHQLAFVPAHILNPSRWERRGCEDGAIADAPRQQQHHH